MPKDLHRPQAGIQLTVDPKLCGDISLNEIKILRDYSNRALSEIKRLRKRHPRFDTLISLFSLKDAPPVIYHAGPSSIHNPSSIHDVEIKVKLPELHTVLYELDRVLDELYHTIREDRKDEKESNNPKQTVGIGRRLRRKHNKSKVLPVVNHHSHAAQPKSRPEVVRKLVRRTQLNEVT